MARKGIIISLASAAILVAAIALIGFADGLFVGLPGSSRLQGYLHSHDGLIRLYVFDADEDIYVAPGNRGRRVTVHRASDDARCLSFRHGQVPGIRPYAWFWRNPSYSGRGTTPVVRLSGVRMRVAAPVAMCLVYPVVAVLRDVRARRRRKPGHCAFCLYDLRGNESGVCPECGNAVSATDKLMGRQSIATER